MECDTALEEVEVGSTETLRVTALGHNVPDGVPRLPRLGWFNIVQLPHYTSKDGAYGDCDYAVAAQNDLAGCRQGNVLLQMVFAAFPYGVNK